MPCFGLPLGDPSPQPERVEVRDVLGTAALADFSAQAKAAGVSTLALSVAMMTETTAALAGEPLRAVFPVHSRTEPRWFDAVGWFITNSVLESADPDPRACAAAVKEAIALGSWPLAPLMEPFGGMPQAPGMFAVSWLDLRRLPVQLPATVLEPQYVSAAIRTDSVMLWFIWTRPGCTCAAATRIPARPGGTWAPGWTIWSRACAAGPQCRAQHRQSSTIEDAPGRPAGQTGGGNDAGPRVRRAA